MWEQKIFLQPGGDNLHSTHSAFLHFYREILEGHCWQHVELVRVQLRRWNFPHDSTFMPGPGWRSPASVHVHAGGCSPRSESHMLELQAGIKPRCKPSFKGWGRQEVGKGRRILELLRRAGVSRPHCVHSDLKWEFSVQFFWFWSGDLKNSTPPPDYLGCSRLFFRRWADSVLSVTREILSQIPPAEGVNVLQVFDVGELLVLQQSSWSQWNRVWSRSAHNLLKFRGTRAKELISTLICCVSTIGSISSHF